MYCVIQLGSSSRLMQLPGAAPADDTIEPLHSMEHMCATPLAQPTHLTGALPHSCVSGRPPTPLPQPTHLTGALPHSCVSGRPPTPLAQPTHLTRAPPHSCVSGMLHGVCDSSACCLSAEVVPFVPSWPSTGEEIEAPETAQTGNVGHLTTPYNTMHSACVYWHIRGDPPPCSERELCVTITCEKDEGISTAVCVNGCMCCVCGCVWCVCVDVW